MPSNALKDSRPMSNDGYSASRNHKIISIRSLLEKFKKSSFFNLESVTDQYIPSLKNSINLRTECMIEAVRNENRKLIDQVNQHREKLIRKSSAQLKDRAEIVKRLERQVEELLKSDKTRDQMSASLDSYLDQLKAQFAEIKLDHLTFQADSSEVVLGILAEINFFRILRANNIDPTIVRSFCLLSLDDGQFVMAYNRKNRNKIFLNVLDSKFDVIKSHEVGHRNDYQEFKLFTNTHTEFFLVINAKSSSEILLFDSKSLVQLRQKSFKQTSEINQAPYRICSIEGSLGYTYALCSAGSELIVVELADDYVAFLDHSSHIKYTRSFRDRINSIKVKNNKIWILSRAGLSVYMPSYSVTFDSDTVINEPLETIRGFPDVAGVEANRNNFLIDSQNNFIFFVGLPDKVSQAIYVNLDKQVIFKQDLNDLEVSDFFIDENDYVYLVHRDKLIVTKFCKV